LGSSAAVRHSSILLPARDLGTPDRQVGVVLVKIIRPKYAVGELVSGEVLQRNDIARPEKQGANP
jgi:hypothetical protein